MVRRLRLALAAVPLVMIGGCAMPSMPTFGGVLGGGDGKKAESAGWAASVSEEQLLIAARNQGVGPIEVGGAGACPPVSPNAAAREIAVHEKGAPVPDMMTVAYRGEITRTARECQIGGAATTVRYGFAGRVLLGPKGTPGSYTLPVVVEIRDPSKAVVKSEAIKVAVAVPAGGTAGFFSVVRDTSFAVAAGYAPRNYTIQVGLGVTQPAPPRKAR